MYYPLGGNKNALAKIPDQYVESIVHICNAGQSLMCRVQKSNNYDENG